MSDDATATLASPIPSEPESESESVQIWREGFKNPWWYRHFNFITFSFLFVILLCAILGASKIVSFDVFAMVYFTIIAITALYILIGVNISNRDEILDAYLAWPGTPGAKSIREIIDWIAATRGLFHPEDRRNEILKVFVSKVAEAIAQTAAKVVVDEGGELSKEELFRFRNLLDTHDGRTALPNFPGFDKTISRFFELCAERILPHPEKWQTGFELIRSHCHGGNPPKLLSILPEENFPPIDTDKGFQEWLKFLFQAYEQDLTDDQAIAEGFYRLLSKEAGFEMMKPDRFSIARFMHLFRNCWDYWSEEQRKSLLRKVEDWKPFVMVIVPLLDFRPGANDPIVEMLLYDFESRLQSIVLELRLESTNPEIYL